MIIAITGSRGFVGSALAQRATAEGHVVRYLDRPVFSLEGGVSDAWLEDVDILVHCAFDFRDPAKNVFGSKKLFLQAKKIGVETSVLLSSLSVDADSDYGRIKKKVERAVIGLGVKVIRPGLIYEQSPKGLLGRIISTAHFLPLIPTIKDSEQYTTHIDDLYQAILAAKKIKRPLMAAANNPVKLEKIISRYVGKRIFLTVPFTFLYHVLKVLEWLPFGLHSDNLKGLHFLPEPDFTETRRLGLCFREF